MRARLSSMRTRLSSSRRTRFARGVQKGLKRFATPADHRRVHPPPRSWLERWLDTCRTLSDLRASNPMMDAVVDEIDGRMIRVGNHWLADFASCNYLGFDLEPDIIAAIPPALEAWGTHPSWSRMLGSPVLYEEIEERLTALLGSEDSLLFPTITHIHASVVPVLAGSGTILLDARAHKTLYDGCQVARGHGATIQRFRFEDPAHLAELLSEPHSDPTLICMDGVNSMTGNAPDLAAFARVARAHGALLYVDDAHGFGVIGERAPDETSPYGMRGNSIVRHLGLSYDDVVLVGGFSKSYSSLLAFVACPTAIKNLLKVTAAPYLYSGPSPVASLASTLAGFDVNEQKGDLLRADLHRMTARVLDTLAGLGAATPNRSGLPIVEVPLADHEHIDAVGRFLFERGIYVTLAAYPLVPKEEVGFRIQVTAANTDEQITRLTGVLGQLADRFSLQSARLDTDARLERAA